MAKTTAELLKDGNTATITDLMHGRFSCWGKKWGKKPYGFQAIPADLDLAKTA
jgi:hypothetical protein